MPGFHVMGTHLLTPWYEARHLPRNAASTQVFRLHQREAPRRERRQWGRTSPLPFSVSTKDVYDLWIIMLMSDQYHAVSQHHTHCPIARQHNLCNFIGMHLFSKKSCENRTQNLHDSEDSLESSVQKCVICQGRARSAGYHRWLNVRHVRDCSIAPPSESMHEFSSRRFPVAPPRLMFFGRPQP